MFKPIKGGKKINIQGLDCWIPPEGVVLNKFTNEFEARPIYKRSEIKKEQYWEIPKKPENVKERLIEEAYKREGNPTFFDTELQQYREEEWDRRLNGFWFYNNGKPTYVTGVHYFYLAHWYIDIGYVSFRIPNMELFYFWQHCVEDPDSFGMVEVTARRDGKCLEINELVRMFDGGVKKAGDVIDGDLLMGMSGEPMSVSNCHSGMDMLYNIIPNKGDSFKCNGDHILTLFYNENNRNTKRGWEPRSFVNVPTKEYNYLSHYEKDHLVLVRTGWGDNYEEVEHIIPPYMLGLYLGDGTQSNGHITNPDEEIINYIKEYAISTGCDFSQNGLSNNIIRKNGETGTNKYRDKLRELDILNNKHIPNEYIVDSYANRMQLLAGLLDTDGHLIKNYRLNSKSRHKGFEIIQKDKVLSEGIVTLARSLGFYVSIKEKEARLKREGKETYRCLVYRISIFGSIELIPCKVKRKIADKCNTRQSSLRTGITVEMDDIGHYNGWEVDGDNRFLLADGTIVHNSYRAACIQYESTSRGFRRRSGIQSKDEQSAIEFFDVHIVQPFTELEHMFKPTIDIQKGEAPKKKLSFSKKVNRSSKRADQEKSRRTKELRSLINYGSQGEKVYDGKKQHIYVRDEAGKVEGCSVYEAHSIIKFCLIDMSDIIGKAIYTTTVEDINDDDNEKGNFKKLWHNSNQLEKGKSGRTITGLYRYFLPAYRTRNFDAYGFPDEDKSLIEFQNEREGLSDHDLIEYIRKFPFSIEEAFWTSADNCIFNKAKIQRARMELEQIDTKDLYETGNLHWKDGLFGSSVVFTESPQGKFKFHKKFNVRAECEARNTVKGNNNRYKPLRKAHRVIGVDPVDHKSTVAESTRSNVGMALYIKYNPIDELSETFVALYLHRPDDPEVGYQDMLMLAHLSGAEMMIENNKPGAVQFAEKVGYYDFVIRAGNTGGINANSKTHQVLASNWEVYIDNSLEKIIFIEILSDLSKFNLIKTTKFDAAMAAGWALVGAYGTRAQELYGTDATDSPIYDSAGFY